jgi:membrane protein
MGDASFKQFGRDLNHEISEDNVFNGAAALAYYLTLAIFPAMIVMLAVIPFLGIDNLDRAIMDLLNQALPGDAAKMFTGVIRDITQGKEGGLLSIGLLFTLWAASNGMYAIMQQLNITYDVKEERSFFKVRAIALGLTILFGLTILLSFALVVAGGQAQDWLASRLNWGPVITTLFAVARWLVIGVGLSMGFAVIYYWGPNVEQKFRLITPGSVLGTVLLALASLGIKTYVSNFGNYDATYGSLGAMIILMLWLYVTGLVILLGSEINALVEHNLPEGKNKGEKELPPQTRRAA